MIIEKVFSNTEDPEENLYSVLMTEEELALFSKKSEEDDKLNFSDRLNNVLDKNPLTIKWMRQIRKNSLSKDPEKNKKARRDAAKVGAVAGGLTGLGLAALAPKGAKKAALAGGAIGTAMGTGLGYLSNKLDQAITRKIRNSGGGGPIDDSFAREADRLAMLDGEMTKAEFKKKWYRNKNAR